MPVTLAPDPTRPFLTVVVQDPYTIEEWREAMRSVLSSETFRASHALLVDRRAATAPTIAFVNEMVSFALRHVTGDGRVAVVVPDPAGFGMTRMAEMRAALDNPLLHGRAFRDYDSAVAWLTAAGD
jgi:hypothetical protein